MQIKNLVCGLMFLPVVSAFAIGKIPVTDTAKIFSVEIGHVWPGMSMQNQTFFLQPDIKKTYTVSKIQTATQGGLFIGLQSFLNSYMTGQLGVEAAMLSHPGVFGKIWEDGDAEFDNYNYSYKVSRSRFALKGKVILNTENVIQPFLSGSLGVAVNRAHHFSITPQLYSEVSHPAFGSRSLTVFTYSVGPGLQTAIGDNWQFGIGYSFADWGKSQLAPAVGQSFNNALKMGHYFTHGLLFNLSFIA